MQRSSLFITIALLAAVMLTANSCTRINGIDNNQVIEAPYSLYFADSAGALFNSNDGKIYKVVFAADGKPSRAITTSANNVLWAKKTLYISTNNGRNFNRAYDTLAVDTFTAANGMKLGLNQSMLINVPEWGKNYTLSTDPGPGNFLGVVVSINADGIAGSWWLDRVDTVNEFGIPPVRASTFTFLANGTLLAYDARLNRNMYKTNETFWKESTGNPAGLWGVGSPIDQTGRPLPHVSPINPADSSWFSYGHLNNRAIAIDAKGYNGAWYSDDNGRNWSKYSGLPANLPLLCINSPFEELCLVGTANGLYKLNTNTGTFEQSNRGLEGNIIIRSITHKRNIYKNGTVQKYVYLATNQGIYQSTDMGGNWVRTVPGNYVAIY